MCVYKDFFSPGIFDHQMRLKEMIEMTQIMSQNPLLSLKNQRKKEEEVCV